MIPLQLTLKNFLSYRDITLDFRGLHTACICGSNGAGKSSLLEAITWVIWGQSRAASEDDVIHMGVENVRVDFQFISDNQVYRIIRSRDRGRTTSLDFQVESGGHFRSLSGKGLRATQDYIISSLRLDYDTFINSAYLRQGRADEFMLRRPSERKQILADLLKLDRYEQLANQAKDISKQLKGQADQLELSLESLAQQLEEKGAIAIQRKQLDSELSALQTLQDTDRQILIQLQAGEHQRESWYQQLTWQQSQYETLIQDCDRLKKEEEDAKNQLNALESLLAQEETIVAEYNQFIALQKEEESLATKFQAYQDAQQQKQNLEQQLIQQINELNLQVRQKQTRLESLQQQEEELQKILAGAPEIESGLAQLHHHRQRLKELDKLEHQVAPLLPQRYELQTEIEREQARLSAKLEQRQASQSHLSEELAKVPGKREALFAIDAQIQELEKKQIYQDRVNEKGQERKNLKGQLETNKQIFSKQIEDLSEKLKLLEIPHPICPLCEQGLDENHRHQVIEKTQTEQQTLKEQIWSIDEQLAIYERELQSLRLEYKQLDEELAEYSELQQHLGQLEAQLEASGDINERFKQIGQEIEEIEQLIASGNYAKELQLELQQLNQKLQKLNYDEQTHALVRGEVERWRWAEIKQAKLEDANRRQGIINTEKPEILSQVNQLQQQIENLRQDSPIQQQIKQLEQYILELGYERSRHQNLSNTLRQSQTCQLQYQQLQQAKSQYPQIKERCQQLGQLFTSKWRDRAQMQEQLDRLSVQMEQMADKRAEIQELDHKIQQQRQRLDEFLAQKGRLEQTLIQLDNVQKEYETSQEKLRAIRKDYKVYNELTSAFGKNGIQTLMIENILPHLEAETNHILARLTGNQLHVQFLTQKAGKGSKAKKKTAKLIDTLDILIADAKGTRPYETYSGGEAFRINFSIRLALARLLAQRSGTALQMLIIDEGFGTQDNEGCDRLIAAINAIASDFACILAVTHMPQFKEAFQHRIEVRKTEQGSHLILSS